MIARHARIRRANTCRKLHAPCQGRAAARSARQTVMEAVIWLVYPAAFAVRRLQLAGNKVGSEPIKLAPTQWAPAGNAWRRQQRGGRNGRLFHRQRPKNVYEQPGGRLAAIARVEAAAHLGERRSSRRGRRRGRSARPSRPAPRCRSPARPATASRSQSSPMGGRPCSLATNSPSFGQVEEGALLAGDAGARHHLALPCRRPLQQQARPAAWREGPAKRSRVICWPTTGAMLLSNAIRKFSTIVAPRIVRGEAETAAAPADRRERRPPRGSGSTVVDAAVVQEAEAADLVALVAVVAVRRQEGQRSRCRTCPLSGRGCAGAASWRAAGCRCRPGPGPSSRRSRA